MKNTKKKISKSGAFKQSALERAAREQYKLGSNSTLPFKETALKLS
jgi:hypothetical protein